MKPGKNDHPGYSCERTPWVLVTGVEPLKLPLLAPLNLRESLTQNVRLRLQQSRGQYRPAGGNDKQKCLFGVKNDLPTAPR